MKRILAGIFMLTVISTQAQTEPATKNFKYDFFSPVAGCFGFDLETWYRNSVTMEYKAGLIGLKLGDYFGNEQFIGGYFSIGPKFYFQLDKMEGIDNYSDFSGFYMKPEILLNYFSFTDTYTQYEWWFDDFGNYYENLTDYEVKGSDMSVSLLMGLGRQWTFRDIVTLDLWFALGYGGNWVNADTDNLPEENYYNPDQSFKYSYVRFGDSPMIFDG
ncbi:MAG TPA: hypothetical protein DCG22_04520, partial [Bacteroidetes bacterium]|nr:hypothetical protein [Bacteroidota bacterium]